MEAATTSTLAPGQPTTLVIRLSDAATGQPVTNDQLATVHEKKLHVFLIDESLGDYHHLHPTPTDEPGIFQVAFTPGSGGNYHLWAEAVQQRRGTHETLHTQLPAAGQTATRPDFHINHTAQKDGLTFQWKASPPLRQGESSIVSLWVTDSADRPVTTLEPLLGAKAHLAEFSADGQHFHHLHPVNPHATVPLQFHIIPQYEGAARFFLQVKYQGREITTSFDQSIFPAKRQAQGFVPHMSHHTKQAAAFAR